MLTAKANLTNLGIKKAMTEQITSFGFVVIADDHALRKFNACWQQLSIAQIAQAIMRQGGRKHHHGLSMWLKWPKQWQLSGLWPIALGYDYKPGMTWDKSKADVGEHIEVKWSANPASNLWIQESDRHDRDIAVLVTGNSPKMHIVGWMPVAVAKKPRYRNNQSKQLECATN
jgi:hypothetical protein